MQDAAQRHAGVNIQQYKSKHGDLTQLFNPGGPSQLFYQCHYLLGPEDKLDSPIDQLKYND